MSPPRQRKRRTSTPKTVRDVPVRQDPLLLTVQERCALVEHALIRWSLPLRAAGTAGILREQEPTELGPRRAPYRA
ncbi:hypothetical protein GCM10022232_29710 [Streptomyces plumbiresistens]|uniref:Uncharacterized protein n=1 Tax=Streptomyces plumbiresistens TaxID=511811 RepID=A0ABP7R5X8_9ACTN